MPKTMMLVPKPTTKASFRERVSRALEAVRSYTIENLLSSDPKTAQVLGFGGKTDAGIVVTARNAFTFSAVFDAVNQGASDVGKLPLNLLKRKQGGGSEHYVESRTYRLLKDEPNPEMSSMDMRQTLQAHAMTRKGGFAEIERDGAGRPFWLWPITPDRVERKRDQLRDGSYGPLYYVIDGKDPIPARDMLDIRGLSYDGNEAYDVIDKARQAIGLALAAEKFGSSFFGSGAGFPGLLGIKNAIGPESMETFRKYVDQQYGPGSWNRFLILDNNPTFTPFGVDPQKAQMNELRTKQVEEVARFFNFPVHKLKNLDRATNNNIEQQDLEYYKGFMLNWTTKWEQECNRKLISPLESRQQFIKHNVNAFLRGDTAARTAFYTAMIDRGVFNADMVLELEDMNPQPNGLGQMYLVQGAMVPKDQIVKLTEAKAAPPPAPAPPPNPNPDDDGVTQDDVDAADARAAQAEQVAEGLRQTAAEAQQRVASLEGAAGATAEQITTAQALAAAETQRANTAELLAAETRRTAEIVQAQFGAAEEERARLVAEVEAERARRAEDVARLETALTAETQRAAAASASDTHHAGIIAGLEATVIELGQRERDAIARHGAESERATALTAEIETARQALATAQSAAAATITERDAAIADANARIDAIRAEVAAAAERAQTLERALAGERSARRGQVSAEISAHRALVADIMRRMIERETERARRHQATPEKLRAWLDSFYGGHGDLMATALLPAVRIHLAWTGSSEDPIETARRLATRHVDESQRQIRVLLDGDADDMAASLPALLHRWESDRVGTIADALMQKELDHVRER